MGSLRRLFRSAGLADSALALPVVLGLAVGALEAGGVWLLVQLANGLLEMDYAFLRSNVLIRELSLAGALPENLSNRVLFLALIGATFSTFLLKNVCQYASSASVYAVMRGFGNGLRKLLFKTALSRQKSLFDAANVGQLQAVVLEHPERIAFRLTDLHQMLTGVFLLAAYLAMMLYVSVKLTFFVLAVSPILYFSTSWLNVRIRKTSLECVKAQADLRHRVHNVLSCIGLVKAHGTEAEELSDFGAKSDEVRRLEVSTDKKVLLVVPIQEIAALLLILVLVTFIAYLVSDRGAARLPGFFVFFYIMRRAATTFGTLTGFRATIASLMGPIGEIEDFLSHSPPIEASQRGAAFPGLRDEIRVSNLSFSYPGSDSVLREVSCTIRRGEMTAIVGPSGAGKSTLVNLLMRFYPVPLGTVFLDGTDIASFSTATIRESIALVSQESLLFNDTLRSNLLYGLRRKVEDAELLEVVRKARLTEVLARLPSGMETGIGERGIMLSGGERQRIAIARAILRRCEIVILDEATSALDTATESLIQAAIAEAVSGRTAIVIAHRLSTIRAAHKVVFLDAGRVVEEGRPSDLWREGGRFAEVCARQGLSLLP